MSNANREGGFYVVEGCLGRYNGPGGDVSIPEGVTEIADGAFAGCRTLTHVKIPEGVIWIGEDAFAGCRNLIHVTIPESVVWIGDGAFRDTGLAEKTIQAAYDQAGESELALEMEAGQQLFFEDDEQVGGAEQPI